MKFQKLTIIICFCEQMWFYIYIGVLIFFLYYLRKYFRGGQVGKKINMKEKVIIITGSSAGIGMESAFDLLKQGATVIFACRDEKKTNKIINSIKDADQRRRAIFIKLDLCSIDSIVNFQKQFKKQFNNVDILMNNAGLLGDTFSLTEEGIEKTLQANHIGHMILTYYLLDTFKSNEGRIINVSSLGHRRSDYSIENLKDREKDLKFEYLSTDFSLGKAWVQYGNTKIGNIYFTQDLAEILEKKYKHIKTVSLHPGAVNTEFSRFMDNFPLWARILIYCFYPLIYFVFKTQIDGAQTQLELCYIDFEKIENGQYYADCIRKDTYPLAKNVEVRKAFMKYSWVLIDNANKGKYDIPRIMSNNH